jgi:hypothetical protein
MAISILHSQKLPFILKEIGIFFKHKHIHVSTELGCKYLFFTKNILEAN